MRLRSLISLGLAASALLVACEDSSSSATAPTDVPAAQVTTSNGDMNPQAAAASSQAVVAFQTLFRQDDVDPANPMGSNMGALQQANANLRSAWNASPTDSRVAFGLAVTTLALRMNEMAGTMQRAQDNGIPLSLGNGSTTMTGGGVEVVSSVPGLARAMATPAKAPLVHELQDTLELLLLPTLDEAVTLLSASWADSGFEFRVALDPDVFPEDTLVIDRSDVGFALSVLQAVRAEIRWMVSYNYDVDMGGSYAWADTLKNISDIGSLSPAQNAAVKHLQFLLSNGSPFLKVRTGKEITLASVPVELRAALARAREAAMIGYTLKAGKNNHIPTIKTTAIRDSFVRVVDSALSMLSGPKDFVLFTKVTCTHSSWTTVANEDGAEEVVSTYSDIWKSTSPFGLSDNGCTVYSSSYVWGDLTYHYLGTEATSYTQMIHVDISKLLALPDFKVFLPQFQWNPIADWKKTGPFVLLDKSGASTSFVDLAKNADALGYDGVKSSIYWADPTFGGVFPGFKSSLDVMECFRKAIDEDGAAAPVAARGPLSLF